MRLFGIEIIADFRAPIVTDEEAKEVAQEWQQAKEMGDEKTRWQASERLCSQGWRWSGKEWYLPGSEQ